MAGTYGLKLGSGGMAYDFTPGPIDYERMRKERTDKTQSALKKNKIAAALLFRPENIRYATSTKFIDFLDRLRYCLVFAEQDAVLFETPGRNIWETRWIKPEQFRLSLQWACQSAGKEATWETAKLFAAGIKSELARLGLAKEPLGIDDIDEAGRQALVEAGLKLVNVMPVLLEARAVKTKDEINCMHMVTALCDAAHYAMYQAIKPGVRERDIRAVGIDSLIRNGVEEVWDVLVSSGGQVGGLSMNMDKIIQPGDVVTIDITRATYMGYTSCYYRNYKVSTKPSAIEKDLHKRSYDRMYKVINAIRPGITTAELAENWATAKEKGLPDDRLMWCDDLAHGLGLWLYEYPICNRLWSPKHPMVIEEGMTMAVEAMEFDPLVGRTKLEEMLVVTASGVEIFSKMPVEEMMIASPFALA
ncbi:MAG: aminopeptidase P family protein [Deltaproteobacteria bacterium]|nr:aminopeptidase P family protein [Deltaproteobacteria bacterium]